MDEATVRIYEYDTVASPLPLSSLILLCNKASCTFQIIPIFKPQTNSLHALSQIPKYQLHHLFNLCEQITILLKSILNS
jgi:hypothetical protein